MIEIKFPVYVLAKDCGEVMRFASSNELTGHIEAIDVENDEYDAWDAIGRRINLVAHGVTAMKAGRIELVPMEDLIPAEVLEQLTWRATKR